MLLKKKSGTFHKSLSLAILHNFPPVATIFYERTVAQEATHKPTQTHTRTHTHTHTHRLSHRGLEATQTRRLGLSHTHTHTHTLQPHTQTGRPATQSSEACWLWHTDTHTHTHTHAPSTHFFAIPFQDNSGSLFFEPKKRIASQLSESRAGHFRYFLHFFNNNKWFLAFFIKLIWMGVGFK